VSCPQRFAAVTPALPLGILGGIARYYRALREVILDAALQLLGAGKRADVEQPQAAVGDELPDLPLRLFVVAGDQHVELLAGRFRLRRACQAAGATGAYRINSGVSYANAEKVVTAPSR
jgi:hypothetical protein